MAPDAATLGAGCLVRWKDSILLVQPNYGKAKGGWMFPGGFVDRGESLEAAAAREVYEETGQILRPEDLKPRAVRFRSDPLDVYFVFEATLQEPPRPIAVQAAELQAVRFWSLDEISSPTAQATYGALRPMTLYFLAGLDPVKRLTLQLPDGYAATDRVMFF